MGSRAPTQTSTGFGAEHQDALTLVGIGTVSRSPEQEKPRTVHELPTGRCLASSARRALPRRPVERVATAIATTAARKSQRCPQDHRHPGCTILLREAIWDSNAPRAR